ncbi:MULTISPECIES: hypothetical protein [unclassified Simplicispira]|uniref:hypothetical protein n=1 Tax=unclassified Simplicispira TaxID=2630407 RepID=UPI000D5E5754|nr:MULTISPECIES: hypothetical protein [unclassified Simplicispira]PVY56734.1 hypothetical protein C8D04_1998 [Simplicispira sp. 125]REG17678.1 hypothetical protein C8D01_2308 [Simplicispira sp. 110]
MYIPAFGADAEFHQVAKALAQPQPYLLLATSYAAPDKLADGMVVLADGTHWNPGSGAGFYGYRNGGWQHLG